MRTTIHYLVLFLSATPTLLFCSEQKIKKEIPKMHEKRHLKDESNSAPINFQITSKKRRLPRSQSLESCKIVINQIKTNPLPPIIEDVPLKIHFTLTTRKIIKNMAKAQKLINLAMTTSVIQDDEEETINNTFKKKLALQPKEGKPLTDADNDTDDES